MSWTTSDRGRCIPNQPRNSSYFSCNVALNSWDGNPRRISSKTLMSALNNNECRVKFTCRGNGVDVTSELRCTLLAAITNCPVFTTGPPEAWQEVVTVCTPGPASPGAERPLACAKPALSTGADPI